MSSDILIFDDDPGHGSMASEVLKGAGYSNQWHEDGAEALSLSQNLHPKLVILDIMMPGMDGISLCKLLRASPQFKDLRILVTSVKSMARNEALGHGADAFLQKPYEPQFLLKQVESLIGPSISPLESLASPTTEAVELTFLGPAPASAACCAAVTCGEDLLLWDWIPGSSAPSILLQGRRAMHAFLTHYQDALVQGLFEMTRISSLERHYYGPDDPDRTPPRLEPPMQFLHEGTVLPDPSFKISSLYMNHPGVTLGLSLEIQGRKIVYCPNNELKTRPHGRMAELENKLKAFAKNADLMIHDARYSPDDYVPHAEEGHSAFPAVVDLAIDAGVERLMLFGADQSYSSGQLDALEAAAKAQAQRQATTMEVVLARGGMKLTF